MSTAKHITLYPVASIPMGFVIKARKIERSEVAHAAPYVREIWDWLVLNANYTDQQTSGRTISRGQLFTGYREIQEELHWKEGFVKKTYTKVQIDHALRWLKKKGMIATERTARGLIITVCNYAKYQDPAAYKKGLSTSDSHGDAWSDTCSDGENNASGVIPMSCEGNNDTRATDGATHGATQPGNLKGKKDSNKEQKKNIERGFVPPTEDQVVDYFREKGYSEAAARKAFLYYSEMGWKDYKGTQIKNWKGKMVAVWFKDENKAVAERPVREVDMDEYLNRPRIPMPWDNE